MSCSGAVTAEERAQEVAAELGVVDIPGMREHLAMVLHDRAVQIKAKKVLGSSSF